MNFANYVIENELGIVETNRSFKDLTSIGCGGNIDFLYTPKNISCLATAFSWLNEQDMKYFIIGNGTNVLAHDEPYHGVVILLNKLPYSYEINNGILDCSAFYPTTKLAYDLACEEIGDLSFLGGIPGLLGGAIYNNSGAYQQQIQDSLIDVTYLNSSGKIQIISKGNCHFGYRQSIFHSFPGVILSARFKVEHVVTQDLLNKRKTLRRQTQPLECKSMGSIFKNNPLISAWKVVDALGMRGFRINDAAVSAKHANFIINLGNAKCEDIKSLICLIQRRAELEYGIQLKCEISEV